MEKDFLFDKKIQCQVCMQEFSEKIVRTSRLRRKQPDFDLRPRFADIDTMKYDVYSCPYCGYSSLSRYFEPLTKGQINLIMQNICEKFIPTGVETPEIYDYDTALSRYEQALKCSAVKQVAASELAYTFLKTSWLCRAMAESMPEGTEEEKAKRSEIQQKEEAYYKKAYEGFQKALTTEDFPICGMDTLTMDYLLACIACHFKEYSFASKAVSNILGSQTADRRMKDKALDLKDIIVNAIKEEAAKKINA